MVVVQTAETRAADMAFFEEQVTSLVKVPLKQHQFDALVSFAYNCGVGNLRGSTLRRKLNDGDYESAALEFHRWNRSKGKVLPGLVRRRAAEALRIPGHRRFGFRREPGPDASVGRLALTTASLVSRMTHTPAASYVMLRPSLEWAAMNSSTCTCGNRTRPQSIFMSSTGFDSSRRSKITLSGPVKHRGIGRP